MVLGTFFLGKEIKAFSQHGQLGEKGNYSPFKKTGRSKMVPTF